MEGRLNLKVGNCYLISSIRITRATFNKNKIEVSKPAAGVEVEVYASNFMFVKGFEC